MSYEQELQQIREDNKDNIPKNAGPWANWIPGPHEVVPQGQGLVDQIFQSDLHYPLGSAGEKRASLRMDEMECSPEMVKAMEQSRLDFARKTWIDPIMGTPDGVDAKIGDLATNEYGQMFLKEAKEWIEVTRGEDN